MPDSTALPLWLIELGFVLYLVGSAAFVILERRAPRTTLAWILAIFLLPVAGLFAYLAFGRRPYRKHVRRCRRRAEAMNLATRQAARLDRLPGALSGSERGLVRLALRAAAAPLRRAHAVTLLSAGPECARSMLDAIDAAERFIHLEFYIWRDDESSRAITAALTRRALEGVRVRVLLDHLGSFSLGAHHFDALREAGGEVAFFARLFVPGLHRPRANFRNHRKLISIDQRIGFVGGINIGDEYLSSGADGWLWSDLLVRLEDDAVFGLETIFVEDWLDATGELIDDADDVALPAPADEHTEPAAEPGALVQIIPSGPDVPVEAAIAAQFSAAIASALERCWIATPYLVPDEALKLTLQTAAMRGVDVRILVPGRSDVRLVRWASRSYYDGLLSAGCRIYEHPDMIHSKYIVVDDTVAAIGSANMDIRSFYLNYEITAMFYDANVNAALAERFEADQAQAARILEANRAQILAPRRALEAFARMLSPLL